MYKTGDLTKNIDNLKNELRSIKFPERLNDNLIIDGNPICFLPIIHFCFLSYSKYVAQYLLDNDYELFSKNDKEFFDKIFNSLIYLFNFRPTINSLQFFKNGQYAEAKVIFCLQIIKIVKQCHNNLLKKNYSNKASKNNMNKANDSFRKKSNDEDYITYKDKIRVINHKNTDDDYTEPNEYKFDNKFISSSPKFNEELDGSYKMSNSGYESEHKKTPERNMKLEYLQDESKNDIYEDNKYYKKNELSSVIEIINTLANSVKDMTSRIEVFKNNIDDKVNKLEADIVLIKNRLNILENNKVKNSNDKNLDSYEHIFSFSDEENRIKDNDNIPKNVIQKIPTKIINDINDTDSIIERVTNRFRETQRLLNDFK